MDDLMFIRLLGSAFILVGCASLRAAWLSARD